ncbi:hypothetical protein BJ875DRAFT_131568 [Amylocarpus encephaloides]|uniref:Uncharacterized protein n=1 Tax=Amylocarpus encephaloides TaxID=45428 RepID=A0A9P8C8E3_9HELO|nr:hypothetical protein BJ875DRAFT_131568 [Amylocarpus encephaloides]
MIESGYLRTDRGAVFAAIEVAALKTIFEKHSIESMENDGLQCWTKTIFRNYLLDRVPQNSKRHFLGCSTTLYHCALYFAKYPFAKSASEDDTLTCDELIRAIAFLGGRERQIFRGVAETMTTKGSKTFRRARPDRLCYENLFRSLARETPELDTWKSNDHDDVVDVLSEVQPAMAYLNVGLTLDELQPIARRLSNGKPPLGSILLAKGDLLQLMFFLTRMLMGIRPDPLGTASQLAESFERLLALISNMESEISFDDINDTAPGTFRDLHYAFAILFSTFMQGKDISTIYDSRTSR